ncbi:LptF/LptG family permease [Leptolyngbya sp. FACHB-36]|nr:LptF/LptG family permease [Leptolyngbya sp. FACHB-36]MBD2020950.1 LptF/LptG family permease [Leptolyngbya sp. FACHB-36]
MDRYIAGELIMPFLFGVGAFSSIGVSVGALFDLMRKITESGLPLMVALQVFLLKMPYFISLAFPMSILLSCLMVYGRLSGDSELIALRSCGVSVYRLITPAIVMGLIVTGITFAFNEAIVPAANLQASRTLDQALNREQPTFQERNIVYQEFRKGRQANDERIDQLSRIFYASEYDGRRMKGLTILDFSQNGLSQIIAAESATWNSSTKIWDFFNGTIYVIAPNGSYRNILRFQQQQLQLPRTPLDIAESIADPGEMNIAQIRQYLTLLNATGNQKQIRRFRLRIDQKMAFPFACLIFALVGSTLGVRPQRTSRATGFGISLVIILCYYLFISVGEVLYQFDILSSTVAGWLPTLIGLAAGTALLVRTGK